MKRLVIIGLIVLTIVLGLFFLNRYWIHRYDGLITRQANVYRLDPALVWSVIYEETYFSPWKNGKDGEIGLMQITPTVGKEWAAETGMRDLERQMNQSPPDLLRDPERNIQIGCWYLEKLYEQYRDVPEPNARVIAAYNAGPSRAAEWNKVGAGDRQLSEAEFINKIDIPSTRAYVSSILERYRILKGPAQGTTPATGPAAPSATTH
ncbi:MAG TPA: lytic transglycosylase domain-containing protein [Pyrinomonadaceae bacterium]|nr:lytic transglycosylase domain-containing protein [Pyrinomonadaceae bacterium]